MSDASTSGAPVRTTAPGGTESCVICGSTLEYLDSAATLTCTVCGGEHRGHVVCPRGHYVCESCHGAGFMERLPGLLDASRSPSPFAIAEDLIAQSDLPMLGCEHAHVAAGALMRALENAGVAGVTAAHRAEVLERTARQAVSAYCGLSGVCGVVPALGACYSVLVGGRCGKGPETRAAMTLVSRLAAATAAEAHPGCCKAYVRVGLREATAFLEEELGIALEAAAPVSCADTERHPHGCRGAGCAWHPDHEETDMTDQGSATFAVGAESAPGATSGTGPAAKARYDEFFELAYAEGVLDQKTKILVALGASLASGCAPWTQYCLSVGRRLGVTDEEVDEVLHAAMTVGATRMQVMLSQEAAKLTTPEATTSTRPSAAAGEPGPCAAVNSGGAPAFAAAEVVEQAGGGWTGWGPDDAGSASQSATDTAVAAGAAGSPPQPASGSTWK